MESLKSNLKKHLIWILFIFLTVQFSLPNTKCEREPEAIAKESSKVKKNKSIGKVILWTLGITAVGGLSWYLLINPRSPLKKKNPPAPPPPPIEKGNYTSITLKFKFVFKGLNASGLRMIYIDEKPFISESFVISDICFINSTCAEAKLDCEKYYDITINATSISVAQTYDVLTTKPGAFLFCPELTVQVINYTWENGKSDPGFPIISNINDLNLISDKHCDIDKPNEKRCTIKADLKFDRPSNPLNAPKVFYVSGGCR